MSAWVSRRLGAYEAIEWAVDRLGRGTDSESIALFLRLSEAADSDANLTDAVKSIWRLLASAARESEDSRQWWEIAGFHKLIKSGKLTHDQAEELVDFVRPRLVARSRPRYADTASEIPNDPNKWVHWDFEANCGSLHHIGDRLNPSILSRARSAVLTTLAQQAAARLLRALAKAEEIGWLAPYDHTASRVRSVVSQSLGNGDDDAPEDRDPDAYNDDFAPISRLLTATIEALAKTSVTAARHVVRSWDEYHFGLFARIRAAAFCNRKAFSARIAARFLLNLDDSAFWRSDLFPEVPRLRQRRWDEFTGSDIKKLTDLLLRGPPASVVRDDARSIAFLTRLHGMECARIVDNVQNVPSELAEFVSKVRSADADFPDRVAAEEWPRESFRLSAMPEGNAEAFAGLVVEELIPALAARRRNKAFLEGDDSEAFARTYRGLVLQALQSQSEWSEDVEIAWDLLLIHPYDEPTDVAEAKRLNGEIARLALSLPPARLDGLVDRLSYWLDAADQNVNGFSGAEELWLRLVPVSAAHENSNASDEQTEPDLTHQALNSPLGRLISFYLRRCPTIPARGPKPKQPLHLANALKQLTGRARHLVANQLITHANYFWRADRKWLKDVALLEMRSSTVDGIRLWEAFARYAQRPNRGLWAFLQKDLLRNLLPGQLTDDAQDRLAQIAILAWLLSRRKDRPYKVEPVEIRAALKTTTDAARGAASRQFMREFSDEPGAFDTWDAFGCAFFREVWPLEPSLQSSKSAQSFARIPSRVSIQHFSNAVETILPHLRPFDVWDVETEFGLSEDKRKVVADYPSETLALINACIADNWGVVYGLAEILQVLRESHPALTHDLRYRRLLAHSSPSGT